MTHIPHSLSYFLRYRDYILLKDFGNTRIYVESQDGKKTWRSYFSWIKTLIKVTSIGEFYKGSLLGFSL